LVFRGTSRTVRAIALVGAIVTLDLLWFLVEGSTGSVAYGLVDEPAHLATCLVLLLALATLLARRPSQAFIAAALVAAVAIDIDHIPAYLGWDGLTGTLPRPYSHSLLALAVLLLAARAAGGRGRQILLGAAFGVGAHLLRDLATGPGVPLFWPLHQAAVTVPYAIYLGALGLAVLATATRPHAAGVPSRRISRRAAPPVPSAYPPSGS
jgi:inner membrane protein